MKQNHIILDMCEINAEPHVDLQKLRKSKSVTLIKALLISTALQIYFIFLWLYPRWHKEFG